MSATILEYKKLRDKKLESLLKIEKGLFQQLIKISEEIGNLKNKQRKKEANDT